MGKTKYKIVKETRINHEYGTLDTSYRVKKKVLCFWIDIGGRSTAEDAKLFMKHHYISTFVPNFYNGQIIPDDEVIGEYEF